MQPSTRKSTRASCPTARWSCTRSWATSRYSRITITWFRTRVATMHTRLRNSSRANSTFTSIPKKHQRKQCWQSLKSKKRVPARIQTSRVSSDRRVSTRTTQALWIVVLAIRTSRVLSIAKVVRCIIRTTATKVPAHTARPTMERIKDMRTRKIRRCSNLSRWIWRIQTCTKYRPRTATLNQNY